MLTAAAATRQTRPASDITRVDHDPVPVQSVNELLLQSDAAANKGVPALALFRLDLAEELRLGDLVALFLLEPLQAPAVVRAVAQLSLVLTVADLHDLLKRLAHVRRPERRAAVPADHVASCVRRPLRVQSAPEAPGRLLACRGRLVGGTRVDGPLDLTVDLFGKMVVQPQR